MPPFVVSEPWNVKVSSRRPRLMFSRSVGFHWSVMENALNFGVTVLYVAAVPSPTTRYRHGPPPQIPDAGVTPPPAPFACASVKWPAALLKLLLVGET